MQKETVKFDIDTLKSALILLVEEKPEIFKNIIKEILREKINKLPIDKEERRKDIERMILEDFQELGDVFRALA
jgi:urease accessory protein UreE